MKISCMCTFKGTVSRDFWASFIPRMDMTKQVENPFLDCNILTASANLLL
jgi:hypothetical protein